MAEIRLEGTHVNPFGLLPTGAGHLYLVYVDDAGSEFVIRGGPASSIAPGLSDIVVEIGEPISTSKDSRGSTQTDLNARGSIVLDLGGVDANLVWAAMLEKAGQIHATGIDYDIGNATNSNSTIASILQSVGVALPQSLPNAAGVTKGYPGVGVLGDFNALTNISNLDGNRALDYFRATYDTFHTALSIAFIGDEMFFGEEGSPLDFENISPETFSVITEALVALEKQINDYVNDNQNQLSQEHISSLQALANTAIATAQLANWSFTDPLVLDLDGDGIELTAPGTNRAQFDFDGDGIGEQGHGWVSGDDALLAIDRSGDGSIEGLEELFGSDSSSGFAELALLDSNGDNLIDAQDEQFSDLLVWQDLNENGLSEQNELASLDTMGIASISLASEAIQSVQNGNLVSAISTYTKTSGDEYAIADINFALEEREFRFGSDDADTITLDKEGEIVSALAGDDLVVGSHVSDTIFGGSGDDIIRARRGDDVIDGGDGDDHLRGGRGDDLIYGGSGEDILRGGRGDDSINGGLGDDILIGGAGSDTFFFKPNDGIDTIRDFDIGLDTLSFTDISYEDISVEQRGEDAMVSYSPDESIILQGVGASMLSHDDFAFL